MKNIRQRKDGRWEGRKYYKGHSYNVIAKTQTLCLKKFKELLKQLKNKDLTQNNKIKLVDYGLQWCEIYKKPFVCERTYKEIKSIFQNKCKPINYELQRLNTLKIQEYLNTMPNNRAKEVLITYLNACLKRAIKDKIILYNPMEDIEKAQKLNEIRPPFTYQQQVEILNAIKGTDIEIYIYVYLFTGIRKNEFDYKNIKNDIQSDGTLRVKCEKKRKQKIIYRYIDLSEKLKNLILNTCFTLNPDIISDKFRKILDNMGIEKHFGLHTLRHTFTTNHFYLGTPDKYVQEWLGHEDIAITKKHYTALDRTLSKEKILNLYPDYYYIVKH